MLLLLLQLKPGMTTPRYKKKRSVKSHDIQSLESVKVQKKKKNSLSILNQAYGLIEQGSGVKTIMVFVSDDASLASNTSTNTHD